MRFSSCSDFYETHCIFRFAGLLRYLHPSDEQLREYAPAPKLEKKDKKKQRQAEKNNAPNNGTFSVPRNIDIQVFFVLLSLPCVFNYLAGHDHTMQARKNESLLGDS